MTADLDPQGEPVTDQRNPQTIQRDIERTRAQLALTLDQLAERASPKRVARRGVDTLMGTPRGRMIVGGAAGVVVAMVVLRVAGRRRRRK